MWWLAQGPGVRTRPRGRAPMPGAALLWLALLGLALPACRAPTTPPLRVAVSEWIGYATLRLAHAQGDLGPQVRLLELPNATDIMRGLRLGLLDAAALTLDEALRVAAQGVELEVVLVLDHSAGADVLLLRPGLTRLADLAGRSVACEQTTVGALVLSAALAEAGLSPGDVHPVHRTADVMVGVEPLPVDAVITYEPHATRLEERGWRRAFDSRAMPGQIIDVLVVRADAVAGRGPALARLVEAHFEQRDRIIGGHEATNAALEALLRQPHTSIEAELQGLVLPDEGENMRWLAGDAAQLAAVAERLWAQLQPDAPVPPLTGRWLLRP